MIDAKTTASRPCSHVLRFPRRLRRVETVKSAPAACPSTLPEDAPVRRVEALTEYRQELRRFIGDTLDRARELDAMRREAVGRSCFDLVDTVPGGGMALHTVAEKLMYGADLALPLRRVFDEAETNLLPLLAVARVLDSQEWKEGGNA